MGPRQRSLVEAYGVTKGGAYRRTIKPRDDAIWVVMVVGYFVWVLIQ